MTFRKPFSTMTPGESVECKVADHWKPGVLDRKTGHRNGDVYWVKVEGLGTMPFAKHQLRHPVPVVSKSDCGGVR